MLELLREKLMFKKEDLKGLSLIEKALRCYLFLTPQSYTGILLKEIQAELNLQNPGNSKTYRDNKGNIYYIGFNLNTEQFRITNIRGNSFEAVIHYRFDVDKDGVHLSKYKLPSVDLDALTNIGVLRKTPSHGKTYEHGADYSISYSHKDFSYIEAYLCK
jgi:hypothetical protein